MTNFHVAWSKKCADHFFGYFRRLFQTRLFFSENFRKIFFTLSHFIIKFQHFFGNPKFCVESEYRRKNFDRVCNGSFFAKKSKKLTFFELPNNFIWEDPRNSSAIYRNNFYFFLKDTLNRNEKTLFLFFVICDFWGPRGWPPSD